MPVTKYIWDGENYLQETDENDVTQVTYTNKPEQYGELISQRRENGGDPAITETYHFDALGSTTELTDESEDVIETYQYDAFGNKRSANDYTPAFTYVGVAGYYHDPEDSKYYVRNRTYCPGIQRFLSKDPLGFDDRLRLYAYAANNASNRIDPNGLFPVRCRCENTRGGKDRFSVVEVASDSILEIWNKCSPQCGSGLSVYAFNGRFEYWLDKMTPGTCGPRKVVPKLSDIGNLCCVLGSETKNELLKRYGELAVDQPLPRPYDPQQDHTIKGGGAKACGVPNAGAFVGVNGLTTSVGVIIVYPDGERVWIMHFSGMDNPTPIIRDLLAPEGSRAIIVTPYRQTEEDEPSTNCKVSRAALALESRGVEVQGIVRPKPGGGAFVGSDLEFYLQ